MFMKRTIAIALSMLLAIALCAVASAEAEGYRIAIVTATETADGDAFAAGQKLAGLFPENVLTGTYVDSYEIDVEDTRTKLTGFMFDPEVKAIVICQAVPGTASAFAQIRDMRSDILLIACAPLEDAAEIGAYADVVVYVGGEAADWRVPAHAALVEAGYAYAAGYIGGAFGERADIDVMTDALLTASGADEMTLEEYADAAGVAYANCFVATVVPGVDEGE